VKPEPPALRVFRRMEEFEVTIFYMLLLMGGEIDAKNAKNIIYQNYIINLLFYFHRELLIVSGEVGLWNPLGHRHKANLLGRNLLFLSLFTSLFIVSFIYLSCTHFL
jgi:hypothetical protein